MARVARHPEAFSLQPTGKGSKRVEKPDCSIDGCQKPIKYRGMCSMHAERFRLYGDPHYKHAFAADLSGQKFGKLTALERGESSPSRQVRWTCLCECGNTTLVAAGNLRSGHIKSCGCLCVLQPNRRTHGMTRTPTYRSWVAMRRRCSDSSYPEYRYYGGRGIKVCERWQNSFENFLADMGKRPVGMSIDRFPDIDGDYEPSNCRWATPTQQTSNTRAAVNGLARACRDRGINERTVYSRIRKGWDRETALNTPAHPRRAKAS